MIKSKVVGLLLVAMSPCVLAQSLSGQWDAYSRTAMAITGPVSFEAGIINLNGKPAFRYEATEQSEYYRIKPIGEKNPTLLNGNAWCGSDGEPSWLRVEVKGRDLRLTVFDQSWPGPSGVDKQTGFCGEYNYSK